MHSIGLGAGNSFYESGIQLDQTGFKFFLVHRILSLAIGAYSGDLPEGAGGVLYAASAATNSAYVGSIYALDANTSEILWTSPPANGQIFTNPAVANSVVYVASGDQDGKVYAFHLP